MSEAIKDESLSAFARRLSDEGVMIHAASWQQITGTLQMCADEIDTQAARIAELESRVHTCGPTCSKAGCINRRVTAERDQLRAEVQHHIVTRERLLLTLTSIHALMYPPPIKTPDGRTMVFRPNDPDPHTILQALSDRIRDIPDTIARAIEAAKEAK